MPSNAAMPQGTSPPGTGNGTSNSAPPLSSSNTGSSQIFDEKSPQDFIVHVDPSHPSTNTITIAPTPKHTLLSSPSPADTFTLLQTFQTALGIPASSADRLYHLEPATTGPNATYRDTTIPMLTTSKNTGIWKSVVEAESDMLWKYRYYRMILSTCLLLQILLGAVLTAMGAARAPHVAITVVSAITTVVAGILALMKGQGLPNRCRQDWRGWKGVKDFIQQKEGEIASGMFTGPFVETDRKDGVGKTGNDGNEGWRGTGGGLEAVWREVRAVEAMYRDVVRTVDGNKPDSYIIIPGVNDKNPGWNDKLDRKGENANV